MAEVASRKMRISPDLMDELFTRDLEGHRLRVEWGTPDKDGFYEPTIKVEEDTFSELVHTVIAIWEHTVTHTTFVPGLGYRWQTGDPPCADPGEHERLAAAEGAAWRAFEEAHRIGARG